MTQNSNSKNDEAKVLQPPIVRHLWLIKAMSVFMALLIVVALVVIAVTIYSRLTTLEQNLAPRQIQITLPEGTRVNSVSLGEKGEMLLFIEKGSRKQIWHYDRSGRLQRQVEIRTSTP